MTLGKAKLLAMWMPAGMTKGDNINLVTEPTAGISLPDYVARENAVMQKIAGSNADVSHAEKLCGNEQD